MKILVFVKQVPDTWSDRKLDTATGLADREASEAVTDEIGERAVEAALVAQKNLGAEVVVATMGPAAAEDTLRKSLAMGVDSALHIIDASLAGADLVRTAKVLAAVARRESADLILAGTESTDGRAGVVPAMIAEVLGLPHATSLSLFEIASDRITGSRVFEDGELQLSALFPAVASITEQAPDARFPSFRGIMKAKKKPLTRISVDDLDIAEDLGDARSVVIAASERPPRSAGTKIVDEGDAGEKIAEYLASARLI